MARSRRCSTRSGSAHEVADGLIYIDLHLVHEVTSPQAFDGLRLAGRRVRRPDRTLATADHNVPTDDTPAARLIADELSRKQVETLERNCEEFGVPLYSLGSDRRGIVHVIGPELGLTQPGMTIVCGDCHTSTHGAFGALAFGHRHLRGRARARHPEPGPEAPEDDADQLLGRARRRGQRQGHDPGDDRPPRHRRHGGYVVEYAGETIRGLSMEGRMTICNMTIEGGGRAGMIAPDETTFEYIEGRPGAPEDFDAAVADGASCPPTTAPSFDTEVEIDASALSPMVTWGTNPGHGHRGHRRGARSRRRWRGPSTARPPSARSPTWRSSRGRRCTDIALDRVFIGSCTNSRIEDLRAAAAMVEGRTGRRHGPRDGRARLRAGRRPAEEEGLHEVFRAAGFEWRAAGCSMCLGMNPDILIEGERCASTSNRNFEGRQGKGGRTHLVSPRMAAAAAIEGRFVDIRELETEGWRPVDVIEGKVSVLDRADVDTDQIIPKQFLKRVERTGFGEFLFYDWLRDGEIELEPNPILVAGPNFGSGSSREHAVWALPDFGFEAVDRALVHRHLLRQLHEERAAAGDPRRASTAARSPRPGEARIDLDDQTVEFAGGVVRFEIEEEVKHRLLGGHDEIAITLPERERDRRLRGGGGADRGPATTAL